MQFNPTFKGGSFRSAAEFGEKNSSFDTGIRKHGDFDLKQPQTKTVEPSLTEEVSVTADSGHFLEMVIVEPPELVTYEGDYVVIPDTDGKTLETKDKYMNSDVTVTAIPYWETSNITGTTVYIADNLLGE